MFIIYYNIENDLFYIGFMDLKRHSQFDYDDYFYNENGDRLVNLFIYDCYTSILYASPSFWLWLQEQKLRHFNY